MAYASGANVISMSNGQITETDTGGSTPTDSWTTWDTWNDSRVETLLNRSFKLYKDTYKLTVDTTVYAETDLFLRTPLIPSGTVNSTDVSPNVFEADTDYPDPSSATALIKNTDYFIRNNHLQRLDDKSWKKYVTVVYHWGYLTVPTDVQYFANLLLLTFVLSTKASSSSSGTSERIGDYQISTSSASTISGSMDDELREIKNALVSKYSPPVFGNYYHQDPSPTLISSENTSIVAT